MGLEHERQVLHLIQKEGGVVRLAQETDKFIGRVGECAFAVSEEHRFADCVIEQGAVDRDDVSLGIPAAMEIFGREFFSCPGFTLNVHRTIFSCIEIKKVSQFDHRSALTDKTA